MKNLLLLFSFVILIVSCQNETETIDESNFGYDYFPIEKGKIWIYASDSIIYDDNGSKRDTFHSFIKEEIGDSFEDEEGNIIYKVNRFFKRTESAPWTQINTWTTYKDKNRAIKTEENLKFIKLPFPIKKGQKWDGNAYIDEEIMIEIAGDPINIYKGWSSKQKIIDIKDDYTFDNKLITVAIVDIVSDSSVLDIRVMKEYYGKGYGLVKKEMIVLDGYLQPGQSWSQNAENGFIHTLTLIKVQ